MLLPPTFVKVPPQIAFVIITTCHSLAIPTTVFRLIHGLYRRRLWWDDFWATAAFANEIMFFVVYVVNPTGYQKPKNGAQYAASWMTLVCYTFTLWCARLTVAVTIVRLFPPKRRSRLVAIVASVVFFLFMAAMVLQKGVGCSVQRKSRRKSCLASKYPGYMELSMDLVADIWLLVAPAYMLWTMKLQNSHRKLIFAIFLCGIFTAAASIVHCVFILLTQIQMVGITGHIEATVAIIVSNLIVLVTYFYRVFRNIRTNRQNANRGNRNRYPDQEQGQAAGSSNSANTNATSGVTEEVILEETISSNLNTSSGASPQNHQQSTSVELTELSYLDSNLNIPSEENHNSQFSAAMGPTPISSFSFSTTNPQTSQSQNR